MKKIIKSLRKIMKTEKQEVNQELICALRLSYNNFDEPCTDDDKALYEQCRK